MTRTGIVCGLILQLSLLGCGEGFSSWKVLDSSNNSSNQPNNPLNPVNPREPEEPVDPVDPNLTKVGKWTRYVVTLDNNNYSGNPFTLEVDATFTHKTTGTTIKMPGYYAGNDQWKVAFMPNHLGEWNYRTSSQNSNLNGKTGALNAVQSGHWGMLNGDSQYKSKWRYADGPFVVPVGVFAAVMLDPASDAEFTRMADFLKESNIQLINFRISEHDRAFQSVGGLTMRVDRWDRFERRMSILAARNIGVEIMLYTDDGGRPSFAGKSAAERLLIRYAVARLAAFPTVIFNSGIDLAEYRNLDWVQWYGQQVRALDPYGHPVSSRYCCGSGNLVMSAQTYTSYRARNSEISGLVSAYNANRNIPAINSDNWSEDLSRSDINGHSREDIRRAAWKATIVGGVGFHIRNNVGYCPDGITECDRYFHINNLHNELNSAQWLKHLNPYIQTELGDTFGAMERATSLVNGSGGKHALADPGRTRILYFMIGQNDSRDGGNGTALEMRLGSLAGSNYSAEWFNPRTGAKTSAGNYAGGRNHMINMPSSDDWVLLLKKQ